MRRVQSSKRSARGVHFAIDAVCQPTSGSGVGLRAQQGLRQLLNPVQTRANSGSISDGAIPVYRSDIFPAR
jgi:hypothetical protein